MKSSIRPDQLRSGRRAAGLTQQRAADRLGVSQAYLALLERGRRPLTAALGSKVAKLYELGAVALPLTAEDPGKWDSSSLAAGLASLRYPGFRQLSGAPIRNPATILLGAIVSSHVEVRVLEALPWLAVEYHGLNWEWLVRESKLRDVQNRLGFVVTLAEQVAERRGDGAVAAHLHEIGQILERARLVREDTLCQESLSDAERRWLRQRRPIEAEHWNLLTDVKVEGLPYVG